MFAYKTALRENGMVIITNETVSHAIDYILEHISEELSVASWNLEKRFRIPKRVGKRCGD